MEYLLISVHDFLVGIGFIQNFLPFFIVLFIFGWHDFHNKFKDKQNNLRRKRYIAECIHMKFSTNPNKIKKTGKTVKEEFFKNESNIIEWLYNSTKKLSFDEAVSFIHTNLDKIDYMKGFNATEQRLDDKNYKQDDKSINYFQEVLLKTLQDSFGKTFFVWLAITGYEVVKNIIEFRASL